jgi:hypothetical protein
MKKSIIAVLLSFLFLNSFSQKWKPNLGLEGGMGGGGMSGLFKTNNPIIVDNSELKKNWPFTGGAFLQVMKPSFGFEVKVSYASYLAEAESFSTPESINLKYLSVPLLLKIRLSSKTGYTSGTWSDESYSLIGNTIYHSSSQYSPGGLETKSVFLYVGGQYDMLKKSSHTYGTTNKITDDLTGSLEPTGYSLVAGLEFAANLISIDFSYQKGMTSIFADSDNKINAFFVKFKFRII